MESTPPAPPRPGIFNRLGRLFDRFAGWASRAWQAVRPGDRAWQGAAWGLLIVSLVFYIAFMLGMLAPASPFWPALALIAGPVIAAGVLGALGLGFVWLARRIPWLFRLVAVGMLPLLLFLGLVGGGPVGALLTALIPFMGASLLGAGVWVVMRGGLRDTTRLQRWIAIVGGVLGALILAGGVYWLASAGTDIEPPPDAAAESAQAVSHIDLPDPSQPGPYEVHTLTYGSGTDRHRSEYGVDADLITQPVDGSPFIEGWEGLTGSLRDAYWGFSVDALPLNGRVWYPDDEGPFPLVLVVHGNHLAEDFSDAGYGYLGELLASRGFITVSVDENFLNTALGDIVSPLEEESDARGWLLLEHLRVWEGFNTEDGNPFFGRVDMGNIALIGHSRGGEAVSEAAAFNRLTHYPDDATVLFDYGFDIQAVAAIAPVDAQYSPAGVPTPLEDVSYFVLHGTHDGDVRSFDGQAAYQRVRFTGEEPHFKAALYIYGANHGQFNTAWGRADMPGLDARYLNLRDIMPAEAQEQVAEVYISAFLEATLHDDSGYIPLFRDARSGADWLPETILLNQYADSAFEPLATFEEDIDVTSATSQGCMLSGENLSVWREQVVEGRWNRFSTSAVYLGWVPSEDGAASYMLTLSEAGIPGLDASGVLAFALADANEDPQPDSEDEAEEPEDDAPRQPIDLTIELVDRNGESARLPLSHYAALQPQLEAQVMKAAFMDDLDPSEVVFKTFFFPLADFAASNPAFDPAALAAVRFVFDETEAGVVVLDEVGFWPGD